VPLPNDDFEAAGNVRRRILSFLRGQDGVGFTVEEITFELGAVGLTTDFVAVQAVVDELVSQRRLQVVRSNEEIYYRYDRWIGLRPN
jgi:hypothetical protein